MDIENRKQGMKDLLRNVIDSARTGLARQREPHADDFVFIHINKTGGSSIEKALGTKFEHRTALEKIKELGRRNWDRKFTFTIVRNPWDKVVSHYHYRVETNQTDLGVNPVGFNEWVKLAYGENDPRYYNNLKMFMPQVNWITDSNDEILVRFVGRFERLEQDFRVICEQLNREASLPHLKASRRDSYRQYYDSEAAEVVARWFAKDIARFGYEF